MIQYGTVIVRILPMILFLMASALQAFLWNGAVKASGFGLGLESSANGWCSKGDLGSVIEERSLLCDLFVVQWPFIC